DRTSEIARANGVDHVIRLPQNGGLARAFSKGLEAALALGLVVLLFRKRDTLDADAWSELREC
ncbi:MAG: hypothetical protein MK082_13750, partial [Phycisphaerales bacterium]|nr:hypothetical protein [Phycisphaerales bacterium]